MDENLGYVLYPPRRLSEPGYPRVDVNLCLTTSGMHFDPFKLNANVCIQGEVEFLTLKHPWNADNHYQLLAGMIRIEDHLGKAVDALTFGGDLDIRTGGECTQCRFSSPAPIFINYSSSPIDSLIVEEVEILLAEMKASGGSDPEAFEKRFCAADPLSLYFACLDAIIERMKHMPRLHGELATNFNHIIHAEMEYLEGIETYKPGFRKPLAQIL